MTMIAGPTEKPKKEESTVRLQGGVLRCGGEALAMEWAERRTEVAVEAAEEGTTGEGDPSGRPRTLTSSMTYS